MEKYTGEKFLNLKIYIDSTGDTEVDEAIKTVFHDYIRRTSPLEMRRPDVKIAMAWLYDNTKKEQRKGQIPLFADLGERR